MKNCFKEWGYTFVDILGPEKSGADPDEHQPFVP